LPWRRLLAGATTALALAFARSTLGGDLAEGNAAAWGSFASDGAATRILDDATHVKAGTLSIRFETQSGFDTGVRFPRTGAAHWDVRTNTHLAVWLLGTNANTPTWQGNQPTVVLQCAGGSLRYEPRRQFTLDNVWSYVRVPLAGDATWTVATNGLPSLADVHSLEFHQDTWGYAFTLWYDGVQFLTVTNGLPPAGPPPPPGVDPDRLRPRVLLFAFDPVMPNKDGRPMHSAYGWTDPVQLTTNALNDLRRSSHGRVVPILETQVHDAWLIQSDGFQYDAASFDADWSRHQMHDSGYDYRRFLADWNLVPRILRGEVDEIWLYSGPFGGLWESTMAGDGGYWCNSGPVQGVPSRRLFVIMGLNFERGVGEAIHSWGHRSESVMVHTYGEWLPNRGNTWSHFALLDKDAPGLGGVGNVHFPVNGASDYDYANARFVLSDADDWLNYPAFKGQSRSINFREWSPNGTDPQRDYLNWWYAHMPHAPGRAPDGYLANWWRYLWDVDQFKAATGDLSGTEGIPTVSITSPTNGMAVAGVVRVTADAAVSGALGRVDFYVDDQYAASDTLAPYTFDWDTRSQFGPHTLVAKAYELQNGTEAVSAPVTVSIRAGRITGQVTRNGTLVPEVTVGWSARDPVESYAESHPNLPVPDNDAAGVTNALGTRMPFGRVASVSVGVTLRHARPGDLEVDLLTPFAQRLRLKATGEGGSQDVITFYPDIDAPLDDLGSVRGGRESGEWGLAVRDRVAGISGILESWSLRVRTELPQVQPLPKSYPGTFSFGSLSAGVYTVTPTGANRWFWPPSITVTNVAESNFVSFVETEGPPPSILTPPADLTVYAGDPASFTVTAEGQALHYQWQHDGKDLAGATSASLGLNNVQPGDLGTYSVIVSNANGWVTSPAARLSFAEFTEGNAASWSTFASDGADASASDDTTHVKVGGRSVRFTTRSGFDTGVLYPRDGAAHWDLTGVSHLVLWIYADNPNFAFQGNQPVVLLTGPGGSLRYEPQREVMPNHGWSLHQIPLAGSSLWKRTVSGTPSLALIDQLELHQDTWDAGFTLYYDGVEFKSLSPPRLMNPRKNGDALAFDFTGVVAGQYLVRTSSDLVIWTTLTRVTATNFLNTFSFKAGGSGPRFLQLSE
jgi:subtilisin-like proprotein convertase family protein